MFFAPGVLAAFPALRFDSALAFRLGVFPGEGCERERGFEGGRYGR